MLIFNFFSLALCSGLQCISITTVRGVPCRNPVHVSTSPHPPFPLPIPSHHIQNPTLWVSPSDQFGCNWSTCEKWRGWSYHLPFDYRNHPTLPPHHGVWKWAIQNCRHFHSPKNFTGWLRAQLYLSDIWSLLSRCDDSWKNGSQLGQGTQCKTFKACGSVLFAPLW